MGSSNSSRTQGQPAAKPALPAGWTAEQMKTGGRLEKQKNMTEGADDMWVAAPKPAIAPAAGVGINMAMDPRVLALQAMQNRLRGGSSSDRGGYSTSGRDSWGGSSGGRSGGYW